MIADRAVRHRQLIRGSVRAHVIEPDDVPITMIELRAVVIVRGEFVCVRVPMRNRVCAIAVSFVHMFWCARSRQGEQRRQSDADETPTCD